MCWQKFDFIGRAYMHKVIFLDIDGVLNSNFWNDSHQKELSDGTLIDEEKVTMLAGLVQAAGAKIVLHSGWRFWFSPDLKPLRKEAEKLVAMLEKEGLHIAGITPDFSTEEIRRTKKFSLVKAKEILAWLAEHPEVDTWVVLDDLDLHDEMIQMHQVKTDATVGLSEEDLQKAEEMLKSDMNA